MKEQTLFDSVYNEQCSAISKIIAYINQYVSECPNKEVRLNENAIVNNIKYIMLYQNTKGETMVKYSTKGSVYDDKINRFAFYDLGCIASVIKNNRLNQFKWIASSDDDCYRTESEKVFDTEVEAYEDMRDAALEKVKWNTEYGDIEECHDLDEEYIGYEIKFYKNKIVHESYSGEYTYKIVRI